MGNLWRKYIAIMLAGMLTISSGVTVSAASTITDGTAADTTDDESTPTDDTADGEGTPIDDTTDSKGTREPVRGEITQENNDVIADILTDTSADDNVVITEKDKPYLALGANLNQEQKKTVLNLMGIDPANLDQYNVVTVTNEEEHQYLDGYLDASTIGTRALSSVVIVKRDKGDGIHISTKNISYCTVGMYKNALATAGLEDADVIVAGPFPLSGTAALIGAMKAYADMENTQLDTESLDVAMNEIVVTGDLVDSLGKDGQSEEFIAYIKQQVLEKGTKSLDDIHRIIEDASKLFDISLTDTEKDQVASLMNKIGSLDIDVDSLLKQASSIYESIAGMQGSDGIMGGIAGFFKGIIEAIIRFFEGLF